MGLARIVATLILILAALCIIGFALIVFLVKFDTNTGLGDYLKARFLRRLDLLSLVRLNQPGDERYIYAGPGSSTITVAVSYYAPAKPSEAVNFWIEEMIAQTTGKKALVQINEDRQIRLAAAFNDADFDSIHSRLRAARFSLPVLHLVYLNSYADKPSYAGITLHRDTIFIFKKTLDDLTEFPETRQRLEQSTIMHEWGHLLGLEHNRGSGCIMNQEVEVASGTFYQATQIPVSYCWNENYQFDKLRQDAGR